jgi:hypothetical protein
VPRPDEKRAGPRLGGKALGPQLHLRLCKP